MAKSTNYAFCICVIGSFVIAIAPSAPAAIISAGASSSSYVNFYGAGANSNGTASSVIEHSNSRLTMFMPGGITSSASNFYLIRVP